MSKIMSTDNNKKQRPIVAVKVTDVGLLPPDYFFEPIVIRALEDVLFDKVVSCGQKPPLGSQVIRGHFKKQSIFTKIERWFRRS